MCENLETDTIILMPIRIITCWEYYLCTRVWEALLAPVEQQRAENMGRNGL